MLLHEYSGYVHEAVMRGDKCILNYYEWKTLAKLGRYMPRVIRLVTKDYNAETGIDQNYKQMKLHGK